MRWPSLIVCHQNTTSNRNENILVKLYQFVVNPVIVVRVNFYFLPTTTGCFFNSRWSYMRHASPVFSVNQQKAKHVAGKERLGRVRDVFGQAALLQGVGGRSPKSVQKKTKCHVACREIQPGRAKPSFAFQLTVDTHG